jgi:hypothetical protein
MSGNATDPDVWHLEFRQSPGTVPAAVRVRLLLKAAGRLGLRCIRVRDGQPEARPADRTGADRPDADRPAAGR